MNKTELINYIRDARIFNIRQIELAAGLPEGTLAKAMKCSRELPDNAVEKILFVFKQCGVKPSKN